MAERINVRFIATVLAAMVTSSFAPCAFAADCDIPSDLVLFDGYLVGRELLALQDEALAAYVLGFINATSLSVAFGAKTECIEQAHQCISQLGTDQVGTALRRYIARDPRRLDEPASHLTFQVMYSRCVKVVDKGLPT